MSKKKPPEEKNIRSSAAEYLTYIAATGDNPQGIEMRYEDENIWLTQKMLAALYDVDVRTVNEHIQKIYTDHELEPEATIRNFRIVQTEGSRQVSRVLLTILTRTFTTFGTLSFITQKPCSKGLRILL